MRKISEFALLLCVAIGCTQTDPESTQESVNPYKDDTCTRAETYTYASTVASSSLFKVTAKRTDQFVYYTQEGQICSFGCNGKVTIKIDYAKTINDYAVRPLSKNYKTYFDGKSLYVTLSPYDKACIEINGDETHPLFVFANPLTSPTAPKEGDSDVIFYKAGKEYSLDLITVPSGKTVYVEGGAVVHACFRSENTSGVTFKGFGIIDAHSLAEKYVGGIDMKKCTDYQINDITILGAGGRLVWSCESSNFSYDNVKALGYQHSGAQCDIFDLYGCHDVETKRCFAYGNDDTFCIKSQKFSYKGECYNISYKDCIAWNSRGNSFEIGYETNLDIHDVTYEDIISIHSSHKLAEGESAFRRGAVTIHCAAAGTVSHIRYNNVYIEDPKEGAIDIRILKSDYSIGDGVVWAPGYIKDVEMKNVHILKEAPTGSTVLGYNAEHKPEIKFIDMDYLGKKVTAASQMNMSVSKAVVSFE